MTKSGVQVFNRTEQTSYTEHKNKKQNRYISYPEDLKNLIREYNNE